MRLLLIEDDALFGKFLKQLFSNEGYRVDWIQRHEAAMIAATADEHFDIVVVALELSGLNWYEWLQSFRATHATIPIITISTHEAGESGSNLYNLII